MAVSRVVVVGGGFAGYHAARELERDHGVEVTLINTTDYFLYLPLLPEVAAGLLEPRRICISLINKLPRTRLVLGTVDRIDLNGRRVGWHGPDGGAGELEYDYLVLATGSVNKLLPIPGVAENAHGIRGIAEALYLRDHITRQIELAAITDDPAERDALCTFVVVGAGYTGTEVVAQGQRFTRRLARHRPALEQQPLRWLILDTAPRLLPELDKRLSRTADRVLRRRGVEVRMGQSIDEATDDGVRLTGTGEVIATRSLIWCVGVRPDPLVSGIGIETKKGRLVVDANLVVQGCSRVFAVGDCAAVPDLTRPGELTGMTAQHAQRQGVAVASNVRAARAGAPLTPYRHHDLGFLVDLGGTAAAANPLHVPLAGPAAKAVTRGYHLIAMPGNRGRTAMDWSLNAIKAPAPVQLAIIRGDAVPLETTRA